MDEKRERRLRTLDEHIADAVRQAEESGELKATKSYGKPLDFGDGYEETPPELRMAMKVLKDGGFAPPEVQMLRDIADLRNQLATHDPVSAEAAFLRMKISELEVKVSMRIERLSTRKL